MAYYNPGFPAGDHIFKGAEMDIIRWQDTVKLGRRRFSDGNLSDAVEDNWGFFEDFESPTHQFGMATTEKPQPLTKSLSLPPPATSPPMYVLESNLDTQHLWYVTAGQRPQQPDQERKYFEKLWAKNFEQSSVDYGEKTSTIQSTPTMRNTKIFFDKVPSSEFHCEIIYRGVGPFSNSVSKSFLDQDLASMTIQLPRFRVSRGSDKRIYAEYLVVVSLGNKSTITFGVWKRHSDFIKLAREVNAVNFASGKANTYKNTILSWQCVLQRKRWFRCLDKDYLALKCFLFERFMHDLLFESSTPDMINSFLGLQ